jgi:polyphenol oxidase
MTSNADHWLRANWPAPAHVQTLMTDRLGGVSSKPWDSMNLGDHVGDEVGQVHINRALLQSAVAAPLVFLKQVHGQQVANLDSQSSSGIEADACIATGPQAACTIMVADCLPILMCDTQGEWVAAAHAGWRGLAGQAGEGVLETLRNSSPLDQTRSEDILVWLGPCIGPQAFEVGDEVKTAFCQHNAAGEEFFKPKMHGKWLADLAGLARSRLQQLGIEHIYGNDGHSDWCTVTNSVRFFSHRRDSPTLGQSGRMAACIWFSS